MGYQQTISKWLLAGIMCLVACTSVETAPGPAPSTQVSPTFQASPTPLLPTAVPTTILPTATVTNLPTPVATSTQSLRPTPTTLPLNAHGAMLLFARNDDLWWSDLNGDSVVRLTEEEALDWGMVEEQDGWHLNALDLFPQPAPDGRWLVFSPNKRDLILVNVAAQSSTFLEEAGAYEVAWSPDAATLAYYAPNSAASPFTINLYDVRRQQMSDQLIFTSETGRMITNLSWSPDGNKLAFACCFIPVEGSDSGERVGQIQLVDVNTGQATAVAEVRLTIAGGSTTYCWTAENQVTMEPKTAVRCTTSQKPSFVVLSPDESLQASLSPIGEDTEFGEAPVRLTIETGATETVLWERQINLGVRFLKWSSDGQYLLLDDFQADSPIWRVKADGSGEPEILLENGFLLFLTPQP